LQRTTGCHGKRRRRRRKSIEKREGRREYYCPGTREERRAKHALNEKEERTAEIPAHRRTFPTEPAPPKMQRAYYRVAVLFDPCH